ncbi:OmpA family protein [Sphingomonas sp. KC8]|uniref:OmpA family protein n=1 Tax=Sphingomonas sp. KC8 TaxID=1030157 RepID=UPI0002488F46|nr:OmpA family protein [Sphingomonas sp. KC8]ARS27734.1 hypothetical protein KC8_10570 [Sphingomonas sp. KC8]
MKAVRAPRWAVSFADLCLLLLGFFVLLQAQNGRPEQLAAGMRSAFGDAAQPDSAQRDVPFRAATLFQPGEAVLTPAAAKALAAIGARAKAEKASIRIVSEGSDGAAQRFDRWELAAARAAAIGRAIRAGGVDERAIDIAIPSTLSQKTENGQVIRVIRVPAA